MSDAAIKEKTDTAATEADPIRKKIEEERTAVRNQYTEEFKELEDLKDPAEMLNAQVTSGKVRLLSDAEYKRLSDKFGTVFSAGMGADALLNILNRVDMEKLRTKLQLEMQSTSGQKRKTGHQAPARRRGPAQVRQQAAVDGADGVCPCCRRTCARWCSSTAAASPPAT